MDEEEDQYVTKHKGVGWADLRLGRECVQDIDDEVEDEEEEEEEVNVSDDQEELDSSDLDESEI